MIEQALLASIVILTSIISHAFAPLARDTFLLKKIFSAHHISPLVQTDRCVCQLDSDFFRPTLRSSEAISSNAALDSQMWSALLLLLLP